MATTLPAVQVKGNVDAGSDDPKLARVDFAGNVDKFNSLRAALGAFAQLSLGQGVETVAQAGGTPDDVRVKLQANSALKRGATGIAADIAGLGALTSAADDDKLLLWDLSGTIFKRIDVSDLLSSSRGFIDGYTMSKDGTDPQNLDVTIGAARNDVNDGDIVLSAATEKELNATFVAGTGNGMLDTGTIAGTTWYHIFAIKNPSTGAVDILASLSPTSPTLPTGFTKQRRIGSVLTDGTPDILEFFQQGDLFLWKDPPEDINAIATQSTTAVLYVMSLPPDFQVYGLFHVLAATNSQRYLYISSPSVNDEVASGTASPLATISVNNITLAAQIRVLTNTAKEIRMRADTAWIEQISVVTMGWTDDRGKDA